jgi:hypothetical protein
MWQNIRCSILFHLLVPGGKWHTEIRSPVSLANRCSSIFHRRQRLPFDPPPSAVTSNFVACGYTWRPMFCHHRRNVSTANSAVSWSMPTPTQPVLVVWS